MSSLRQQVLGIIETCKTVLATTKGNLPEVDGTTAGAARAALDAAKAQVPNDKVLASITLESPLTWTGLLTAMETVHRTLPLPKPAQVALRRG
jgi:hypothetical protein